MNILSFRRRRILASSVLLWFGAMGGAVCGAGWLVRDGEPQAEIVISSQPARMTALAAEELQSYVEKITGATLPITTHPTPGVSVQVYIGTNTYTAALGLSDDGLDHGAFRIASGTNWLALVGRDRNFTPPEPHNINRADMARMQAEWDALNGHTWGSPHLFLYKTYHAELGIWEHDERGSLNAVHEFLRDLGVRWYFPGPLGEAVPQAAAIPLPETNKVVHPDFAIRHMDFYYNEFYVASAEEVMWQLRLGLNTAQDVMGLSQACHGTKFVHTRDEIKATHPEYYALWEGVRAIDHRECGAPCLSSEGLYTQNVEYLQAVFDIYGESMHSVGPCDGYYKLCECGLCAGKDTPERGSQGLLSDYVWGYVDRVARAVYATHPDRKVSCVAYGYYKLPPADIPALCSNVVMEWCQWRSEYRDEAAWNTYTNQVAVWMTKVPSGEMFKYDYYLHCRPTGFWEGVPVYFPHVIARDLQFLKGRSLGDYVEVYRSAADETASLVANHLNCYVSSRLYWDADQSVDDLLDDYYEKFYGPAAAQMKAFIEYCETYWPVMRTQKGLMDEAFDLLAAARAAAGSGVYGDRVDLLVAFVEPLKAWRATMADHYVAQDGQTPVFPFTNWVTAASNIQDAVNAVDSNVVIRVGPGRYTRPANSVVWAGTNNVVYINRPLTLRGSSSAPESTVIDGGGSSRGIAARCTAGAGNRMVLDGFTISNCVGWKTGGGLIFDTANLTWTGVVLNCAIVDNRAAIGAETLSRGGGIDCYSTAGGFGLVVSNCVLRGNRAEQGAYGGANPSAPKGEGGGIYFRGTGLNLIADCRIEDNTATSGGGVYFVSGRTILERCAVRSNYCPPLLDNPNAMNQGGGGVGQYGGTAVLRNSLVADNAAPNGGGGGLFNSRGLMQLYNCTIASNTAATGFGSGIRVRYVTTYGAHLDAWNSIVYYNIRNENLIADSFTHTSGARALVFTNCCIASTNGLGGSGSFPAPPQFKDRAGWDFRLARTSPCVDAGMNQGWMEGAVDLVGTPRIQKEIVDVGCYERLLDGTLFQLR